MRTVRPADAILSALFMKTIDLDAAKRYYSNWVYFEDRRASIESAYDGKWVASLNGQIFSESSIKQLKATIAGEPNSARAYIEHIGRMI